MVSIYSIKPAFQKALRPILVFLAQRGVTPNQVTLFTMMASIAVGLYLCFAPLSSFWMLPAFLLVRMALNAVDGMLARNYRMQTRLGTYLNEMGDIVSDVFLYLPFLFKFPSFQLLFGAIIFLSVLSEVAGILAIAVGSARRYDGPMGKSDRAFYFGVLGLMVALDYVDSSTFKFTVAGIAAALLPTIYLRIRNGIRS
jgi:CDP-diacylglycerol--glycerol-3-phosphate 3-phosphatidyltransferase